MPDTPADPDIVGAIKAQAQAELSRADHKAQAMFSVCGVLVAAVVVLSQRPMPLLAGITTGLAVLALTVSLLYLLSAVSPRLRIGEPGNWLHAAKHGPSSLHTAIREARSRTREEHEHAAVVDAAFVCALAMGKYRRVRTGRDWLVIGILAVLVSRALAVLA